MIGYFRPDSGVEELREPSQVKATHDMILDVCIRKNSDDIPACDFEEVHA